MRTITARFTSTDNARRYEIVQRPQGGRFQGEIDIGSLSAQDQDRARSAAETQSIGRFDPQEHAIVDISHER